MEEFLTDADKTAKQSTIISIALLIVAILGVSYISIYITKTLRDPLVEIEDAANKKWLKETLMFLYLMNLKMS